MKYTLPVLLNHNEWLNRKIKSKQNQGKQTVDENHRHQQLLKIKLI